MGNFKERLLGLIDDGACAAKTMIDTVNETMNSIDWDAQFNSLVDMKNSLLEKSNQLFGEFNELMKQVKNNITDFEVIVPFDETLGEKFECKVENGNLIVEVTFKNDTTERSNKTTVMIPKNCDIEKMTQKYNAVNKTMTVIIPKIIVEPKKEEEETKNGFKLSKMATPNKKVVNEETHQTESKLLKKFRENTRASQVNRASATPRGANGRFVKRN